MTGPSQVVLLANPDPRNAKAIEVAHRAARRLENAGIDVDLAMPDSEAGAREVSSQAATSTDVDALIVSGGDGIASLALQDLVGTDTSLGILPAGTGNDLARALEIPAQREADAINTIIEGHSTRIDVGHVVNDAGEERYFATVLAAGYDSVVNEKANTLTRLQGSARYVAAGVMIFPRYQPRRYRLTLQPGATAINTTEILPLQAASADPVKARAPAPVEVEIDAMMCTVGNTAYYGGGMKVSPASDPHDGLLDVVVIAPDNKLMFAREFLNIFPGKHLNSSGVSSAQVTSVRIEVDGITAYGDGDPMMACPLTVSSVPASLSVLVPQGQG